MTDALVVASMVLVVPFGVTSAGGVADLEVVTVSGAAMGDHLTLAVRVTPSGRSDQGSLVVDLSAGLRPLEPPDGCRFVGVTWQVICKVPAQPVNDPWEVAIPLLATATGSQSAENSLRDDGGDLLASASVSIPVDLPDVVRRYAPELRFHGQERYWPMDVESFLASSELRFAHDHGCLDAKVLDLGAVTPDALGRPGGGKDASWPEAPGRSCGPTGDIWLASQDTRPGGSNTFYEAARRAEPDEGFFLDLDEDAQGGTSSFPSDGRYGGDVPVYVQYRAADPQRGDGWIRYWVLYGCSTAASLVDDDRFADLQSLRCLHQGDWEGVAVRIDRDTGLASEIAYFAHQDAPHVFVFTPDSSPGSTEVELTTGVDPAVATHPVVYVGAGSHASYASSGDHDACIDLDVPGQRSLRGCGTDLTADDRRWATWEGPIRSAEEPWFGYGGAWGAVGRAPSKGTIGPAGPGLVDPLPASWPDTGDDAVPRCDAGEQHPESEGRGGSCDPVDTPRRAPQRRSEFQVFCRSVAGGQDGSSCEDGAPIVFHWRDRRDAVDGYRILVRHGRGAADATCDESGRPERIRWTDWSPFREVSADEPRTIRGRTGAPIRELGRITGSPDDGQDSIRVSYRRDRPLVEFAITAVNAIGGSEPATWVLDDLVTRQGDGLCLRPPDAPARARVALTGFGCDLSGCHTDYRLEWTRVPEASSYRIYTRNAWLEWTGASCGFRQGLMPRRLLAEVGPRVTSIERTFTPEIGRRIVYGSKYTVVAVNDAGTSRETVARGDWTGRDGLTGWSDVGDCSP